MYLYMIYIYIYMDIIYILYIYILLYYNILMVEFKCSNLNEISKNTSPQSRDHFKRKVVFQPSLLMAELLVFGGVLLGMYQEGSHPSRCVSFTCLVGWYIDHGFFKCDEPSVVHNTLNK